MVESSFWGFGKRIKKLRIVTDDGSFVDYLMVAQNSFSDYNGLKYAIR